jgi:hypothetical protein
MYCPRCGEEETLSKKELKQPPMGEQFIHHECPNGHKWHNLVNGGAEQECTCA